MARTYHRDARGRFAGGGGSKGGSGPARPTSPRKHRGLVTQRRAVAQGRQKLAAKQADPVASPRSRSAQKGALTRAQNKLTAAKQSGRRRIQSGAQPGVIRPGRRGARPANGIRPISARLQTSRQIGLSPTQWLAQEERNAAKYGNTPKPKPKQQARRRPAAGSPRSRRLPYEPQTAQGLADSVERFKRRRSRQAANGIQPGPRRGRRR